MPNYVRAAIAGGTVFFTIALLERRRRRLTEHIGELRDSFRTAQQTLPFRIDASVILPDDLHCIWTLPEDAADDSTRWRLIESVFTRTIPKTERRSIRRVYKNEGGIWQRRFWEHAICDQTDFDAHVAYIHYNPVRHGLARRVSEWPYSSFHRYVEQRWYPVDWAAPQEIREWYRE